MMITKIEAARIQLDEAINLFFKHNHVCALSLAGAAENILDRLITLSGKQGIFDFLYEWYKNNYKIEISKKDFSQNVANSSRNWLKHSKNDASTSIDITEKDSIQMLMRAVPTYYRLTKKHTENMNKFKFYVDENIEEIDKIFL